MSSSWLTFQALYLVHLSTLLSHHYLLVLYTPIALNFVQFLKHTTCSFSSRPPHYILLTLQISGRLFPESQPRWGLPALCSPSTLHFLYHLSAWPQAASDPAEDDLWSLVALTQASSYKQRFMIITTLELVWLGLGHKEFEIDLNIALSILICTGTWGNLWQKKRRRKYKRNLIKSAL